MGAFLDLWGNARSRVPIGGHHSYYSLVDIRSFRTFEDKCRSAESLWDPVFSPPWAFVSLMIHGNSVSMISLDKRFASSSSKRLVGICS